MSNLDAAIEEINRVLIGNKSREVEEVYLRNSVRLIKEFQKQPDLNQSQQWHLNALITSFQKYKDDQGYPFYISLQDYFSRDDGPEIDDEEFKQVLQAFSRWAIEQEEQR
ncbi:hypothetical protein [Enterococcus faecalis]|uniref:hypothetical protein n=1 Tax=Enterococcus faecalis TaxID=1351 RepID=UPI001151DB8B|nr:hypothetical protein [Enterococcus faecalis]QDJ06858.1 hypothetical protein FLL49_10470 [Enterococcus faecalis]